MLNAEKFNSIKTNALKNKEFSIYDHVKTLVRHTEMNKALDKLSDAKQALEEAHAGIDYLTIDSETARKTLKEDTDDFIKNRKEYLDLKEECEKNCISIEKVTSLHQTDKVHIVLMAHTVYSGCLLSETLFDPEQGGTDFSSSIDYYFKKATVNAELKNKLCLVFKLILGEDGDYFYGIKPKKSDFEKSDIIHFLSRFSARARKNKITSKKDKTVTWSDFKYRTKTDRETQRRAFTEFCAVVLDNADKHIVVKPEEENTDKKAEKKTSTK